MVVCDGLVMIKVVTPPPYGDSATLVLQHHPEPGFSRINDGNVTNCEELEKKNP